MSGRRLRALLLALALAWALAPASSACQSCFGAEESPLVDGARLGAFALIVVTLGVQGGFAAFFLHIRKRSKAASSLELEAEWSEFQKKRNGS